MAPQPEKVIVHPLVLLSVQDHYNRVAKDTKKRVVGVILGESYKGRIDCTNSFAGGAGCGDHAAAQNAAETLALMPCWVDGSAFGREGIAWVSVCLACRLSG